MFNLLEKINNRIKNQEALKTITTKFKKVFKGFIPEKQENSVKKDYKTDRQLVGNIIIAVLTERTSVRQGLLLFPKGCADPSIRAAWHALCHYEADEDFRSKDIEYNNQQVEFLEMIAFTFKDGDPLPQNIIDSYEPFYKNDPISYEDGIRGLFKRLFRFLNF